MHTRYIIVGQGIAGSLLSYYLHKAGEPHVMIDKRGITQSSEVAAGMFNPVIFRRITQSWMAETLMPLVFSDYPELEQVLGDSFFHAKPLVRLFGSAEEVAYWKKMQAEPNLSEFLSPLVQKHFDDSQINQPFGGAIVHHTGYLDLKVFLSAYRKFLNQNNRLIEDTFDYTRVQIHNGTVQYGELHAEKIIFCEGSQSLNNPFFKWLPFNLCKGEILTIEAPDLQTDYIINKDGFVLPLGNHLFRTGSTYTWDKMDNSPTEEGRAILQQKLAGILKVPYKIVAHDAGIRPTVFNRRPFIGANPEVPELIIFNGLGSKGVMLAPWLARQLTANLLHNEPLHAESVITRYNIKKQIRKHS